MPGRHRPVRAAPVCLAERQEAVFWIAKFPSVIIAEAM